MTQGEDIATLSKISSLRSSWWELPVWLNAIPRNNRLTPENNSNTTAQVVELQHSTLRVTALNPTDRG